MERLKLRPGIPVVVIVLYYSGETPVEIADILLAAYKYKLEYVTKVDPLPAG
jgi:GntR family transcriptional regulator